MSDTADRLTALVHACRGRRVAVVGDKWLDVGLANQAGARGILVRTGYGADTADAPSPGVRAERIVETLADAADYIISTSEGELESHE